jgi:hypothetical protein
MQSDLEFKIGLEREKRAHRALTLSRTFSSLNASTTATAAAHDTAFPAYVPPYDVGLSPQRQSMAYILTIVPGLILSVNSFLLTTALSGNPLASP